MAPNTHRRIDLFLVLFLGMQLLLPLRGFLWDKLETRGDFSWNMYSQRYRCRATYFAVHPDGRRTEASLSGAFRSDAFASKVMHRDRLPAFHRWLCRELERSALSGSRLRGSVSCRLNLGPTVELLNETRDPCRGPEFGVLRP